MRNHNRWWDVMRLVFPQRSRLNSSGLLLHYSTLMLTPPAGSQCRLSQQHPPPWGQQGGGGASSADNTPHPRRKHGFPINEAQIRCSHTAESEVRGPVRRHVSESRVKTEE
ncbi:unnamed protein product [Pleuronectes platessa]|uniref:Uncharacterized protein n=1 Tax=Pleuronectes platessa TaxID=8262 RepID=A0A9N7ZA64_PLEPL|nr:unnamed protein product [Pleuronectes platessa]